jgi:hypothetical protein
MFTSGETDLLQASFWLGSIGRPLHFRETLNNSRAESTQSVQY